MEAGGKKIKTKKGFAIVPLVMQFLLTEGLPIIIAIAIIGLAFFIFASMKGDANTATTNSDTVTCGKWADVGEQEQTLMKQAATEAGIHPALLAAIYWQENGKTWKPMTADFPCGTNGCGPFQLNSDNREAYGLSEAEAKDFTKSVGPAAKILKSAVTNLGVDGLSENEDSTRAVALAYNRGPCVAKKWVEDGRPLSAEKIKTYQDACNYATSVYPRSGFTPMELAQIGLDYLMSAGTMFKDLAKGCDRLNIIAGGSYSGESFISTCQGVSTNITTGGKVIVLDPGHDTPNNNAGATGEGAANLEVALQARTKLIASGYTVYLTRGDPNGGGIDLTKIAGAPSDASNDEDNKRRAVFGNSKNAALVFRIHGDAGGSPGYYFIYPRSMTADRTGHVGPPATIAAQSKDITEKISRSLATQGLTKQKDPGDDVNYTSYKANLVGSSWSTVPVTLIEMFGMTSANAKSAEYKTKMANGIAKAISDNVPITPTGSTTVVTQTKACSIANYALQTVEDVTENDGCKDGNGFPNGCAASSKSAGASNYASNPKKSAFSQTPKTRSWYAGSGSWPWYADCGSFVGYIVRSIADPAFPLNGSSAQFSYVKAHPEKYEMLSNNGNNLKPGDILFRGSCNADQNKNNDDSDSIRYECSYGTSKGFGHIEIYVGDNSKYPGYAVASASYGSYGPKVRKSFGGTMGVIARIKN
jgi:N-acetylmuramoyl-L-alanine amidase